MRQKIIAQRPPNDVNNFNNFDLEDAPTPPGRSQPVVPWVSVSPDYFKLLGLNLLQGRLLDRRDLRCLGGLRGRLSHTGFSDRDTRK